MCIKILPLLVCVCATVVHAAERPRMVGPSPGDEAARTLMECVAESCNNRDIAAFLNHFTPRKAASIRNTMRELFIRHDLVMEIQDISIVSETEQRVVFNLTYGWNDRRAAKQVLDSTVVAVKNNGTWQIQSEVLNSAVRENEPEDVFDLGPGGQVVLNPADDDFWLPRDIAKRPGGCIGGQCRAQR